jgi:hypothetical protein
MLNVRSVSYPLGFQGLHATLFGSAGSPAKDPGTVSTGDMPSMGYEETQDFLQACSVLGRAISIGALDPRRIQTVCDFGACMGASTYALKRVLRLAGEAITALEQNSVTAKILAGRKIIPSENVLSTDGIDYLRRGQKKFDLIAAFMLSDGQSPIVNGVISPMPGLEMAEKFIEAVPHSLNPGGKLLVCSDENTMNTVLWFCSQRHLKVQPVVNDTGTYPILGPMSAVVSF